MKQNLKTMAELERSHTLLQTHLKQIKIAKAWGDTEITVTLEQQLQHIYGWIEKVTKELES